MNIELVHNYCQAQIARLIGKSQGEDAALYAAGRWGRSSSATAIVRAAVLGVEANDLLDGSAYASAEAAFIEAAWQMTILGRLQALRMVPTNVAFNAHADTAVAYWTGESKAIRVSRSAFTRTVMKARKVAAMLIVSEEALRCTAVEAENLFRRDLMRAVTAATDAAFIDPNNAGSTDKPASINNGIGAIASTGSIADDLEAAVEAFTGDVMTAAWVMHPTLACSIALRTNGTGLSSDLGLRGGTLLGLPAIVSQACPVDSNGSAITLLDAAGIAVVDEGMNFDTTDTGAVEMADDPTGATDTPTAATHQLVSLFQADAVAAKVVRRVNWGNGRAGGVVVVEGCSYAGS